MRLIDADDLGIGKANPEAFIKPEYAYGWNSAIEAIEAAPTIDAVPVVHGRWIPTYHKYYNRDGECLIADEWHCSECGAFQRDTRNYCPNCGARMDGEADV